MTGPATTFEERAFLRVEDPTMAAGVRRAAVALAEEIALPERVRADIAIVAMEMATNLARHADDGVMLLRIRRTGDHAGIELLAIDHGPGMDDMTAAARDGHSTGGTLGIGLGAIGRLSDELDAYSRTGSGTVLAATLWGTRPATVAWNGAVCRPIDGEELCGDGYGVRVVDGRRQVMLCDGLGHGAMAAHAARALEVEFRSAPDAAPAVVLRHLHARIRHTRGAVAAVAELDDDHRAIRFAGVGNVAATIVHHGEPRRSMVSLPGIVGQQVRGVREFDYPMPADGLVVLHSDGLTERWNLDDYPGLETRTPVVIAATLLRDAGRRRDDAGVLVVRI